MAKLAIIVPILFFAFVKQSEAVRCWQCSSDLNPFCNDPFNLNHLDYSGYIPARLENCDANTGASYPYLTSSKSACKKQKKYVNGQMIISRGCTWKRSDDYSTQCPMINNPNEIASFCETCEYDGCNSATSIGKTVALLIAPLGLLLFK
ncbi:uncharacterized protein LOC121735560 [Aricia agestis]|uniref:uncharacterized protein LOC121735560 n=1 Tax=Aricia agestis TaxID=91739 RepID=UPI001C209EE0|nr:uncharacterized protein LOC121735560 [Aricia agestis]